MIVGVEQHLPFYLLPVQELDHDKIINETEVGEEIINLQEKHSLIDDAIKQGGRIICINGTYTDIY